MTNRTDQDHSRRVGERIAPATTPSRATIAEDREALTEAHDADRPPTPEEEAAAERAGKESPEVDAAFHEANVRGANQKGEGKPGL